uniref:Uncharacterized protein n=1 Tax=Arundo donax TaxID=35708 RepID=A0A0A9DBC4_ARUDO
MAQYKSIDPIQIPNPNARLLGLVLTHMGSEVSESGENPPAKQGIKPKRRADLNGAKLSA